ncbi:MAG: J domain-containing protein [Acidimicrobiales bacterium]
MTGLTLYRLLGVEPDATVTAVKKAWHKAVLREHPDRGGDPATFRAIHEAYEVLSDPVQRAEYDSRLTTTAGPSAGGPGPSTNRRASSRQTVRTHRGTSSPLRRRSRHRVRRLVLALVSGSLAQLVLERSGIAGAGSVLPDLAFYVAAAVTFVGSSPGRARRSSR